MNRGEIWWVERPEVGRRPHLILTREGAIPVLHSVLAVPTTRTIRGIPTEVRIGKKDGMHDECALTLDNATVMPKSFFVKPICRLSKEKMAEVCDALAVATGCA